MRKLVSVIAALALLAVIVVSNGNGAGASTEGAAWPHKTSQYPPIFVEAHTDGHWGVLDAVEDWGLDLHYGTCRAGFGCIRVYMANLGPNELGYTKLVTSGGKICGPIHIYMSKWWSTQSGYTTMRHNAVRHELGHALGLAHDSGYHAVMNGSVGNYPMPISSYERAEMRSIYGIK